MYGHRKHPSSEAFLRRVDRITLKFKISFRENLCHSAAEKLPSVVSRIMVCAQLDSTLTIGAQSIILMQKEQKPFLAPAHQNIRHSLHDAEHHPEKKKIVFPEWPCLATENAEEHRNNFLKGNFALPVFIP